MLSLVLEHEAEDVAAGQQRVGGVEFAPLQMSQHPLPDAREIALHLAACREILRLFARRLDGIKDSLVPLVRRWLAVQFLQEPVGLEDADVRQMPDHGAKAEPRAVTQILFARQVEERERTLARPCHLFRHLFRQPVSQSLRPLNSDRARSSAAAPAPVLIMDRDTLS